MSGSFLGLRTGALALLLLASCGRSPQPTPPDASVSAPTEAPAAVPPAPSPPVGAHSLDAEVARTVHAATLLVLTPVSSGSGFVVAASRDRLWVLTNDHVINSGIQDLPAWVALGGDPWRMKVVLRDPTLDLALLESHTAPRTPLPVLAISAEAPAPGTHVAAAGFPGGFSMAQRGTLPNLTVSTGQVRAEHSRDGRALLDIGVYGGSSGGPVVDASGNVVGVVVAHVRGTLLTQMIPAARAREFVKRALPENALPAASVISGLKAVSAPSHVTEGVLGRLAMVEWDSKRVAAPVVRQRNGRIYLLAAGPLARALRQAGATPRGWLAVPGPSAALQDLRVERTMDSGAMGVAVLSARAPGQPVTPVDVGSVSKLLPTAPMLLASAEAPVLTTRPFMRLLTHERGLAKAFLVDVGIDAQREGDPVFHSETGALLGFVAEPVGGFPGAQAVTSESVMEEVEAVEARLRTGSLWREGCELVGTLEVDDPLGTVEEAGLIVEEPGTPALFTNIYSVHPIGPVAARADPSAAPPFRLRVTLEDCTRPLAAQLYMATKRGQWLSAPVQVPAKPAAALALPFADFVWSKRSSRDTPWRRPEVTAAAGTPGCLAPPGVLEPEAVYLTGRSSDGRCPGRVVRREDGSGTSGCILLPSRTRPGPLFIQADGALVYEGGSGDIRVAGPDVLTRAAPNKDCRPATQPVDAWQWNDAVLIAGACRDAATGGFSGFFTWPDGRTVAACGGNRFVAPWALPPSLHGGGLVRLGHGGHILVMHPFGGLAVLAPDGAGSQVVGPGLPAPRRVFASAATPSGFLVVFAQAGDSKLPEPALFAIGFDGRAVRRGALPSLPAGLTLEEALLDVTGTLHVVAGVRGDGALKQVLALRPGRRPQVVYDDRRLRPQQRLTELALLSGGASLPPPVPPWPAANREAAVQAGWRFRQPPRFEGPCASTLSRLRPEAVYAREGDRVFDPQQPHLRRHSHEKLSDPRVTGDGRLVSLVREPGPEHGIRAVVREHVGDHAWPDESGRCTETAYGDNPDPFVGTGAPCGEQLLEGMVAHPDGGELSLVCGASSQKADLLRGGTRLRVDRDSVLHGGTGGRVLLLERTGYAILSADGTRIPVRGIDGHRRRRAIRARGAGFDLVLLNEASDQFELWSVSAKGQGTRVAAYARSAFQLAWRNGVLGRDRALYAVETQGASQRILRWRPGARRFEVAWTLPAGSRVTELLTGP